MKLSVLRLQITRNRMVVRTQNSLRQRILEVIIFQIFIAKYIDKKNVSKPTTKYKLHCRSSKTKYLYI